MKVDLPLTPPPTPPLLLRPPHPTVHTHLLFFCFCLFCFFVLPATSTVKYSQSCLCRLLSRSVTFLFLLFFWSRRDSVCIFFSFLSVQNGLGAAHPASSAGTVYSYTATKPTSKASLFFCLTHTDTDTHSLPLLLRSSFLCLHQPAFIVIFLILKTYFFSHTFRKKSGYYIT